jgi:hypothetical protein
MIVPEICQTIAARILIAAAAVLSLAAGAAARPIAVHPRNPHCFLFRGKPTVLITSGEHYGAVLNADFDFVRYLSVLHGCGFNYTRIFTGAYCEDSAAFGIRHNTLAPAPGRFLCPWRRSDQPGYANGGNRFDLRAWDPEYFRRLKGFVREADRRGIVVEVSLFCPFYDDSQWKLSPMNVSNNVNGVGRVGREAVYTLKDPGLTEVQDRMVRQIVRELSGFDNVFYEICNEPYFGGVTLEWQRNIAAVIAGEEKSPTRRHLIAQNIGNGSAAVKDPDPAVSILNFHYCSPPDAVRLNWALKRVVGFDETGFQGNADRPYRTDAWSFLVAGGGLYNNLDYSFTVAHPDGTEPVSEPTPGGGGPALRAQLAILKRTIESLDFADMRPADETVQSVSGSNVTVRVLARPGKAYLAYLLGGTEATLVLNAPPGKWVVRWIDTKNGSVAKTEVLQSAGAGLRAASPKYSEDIALTVVRVR